MDSKIESEDQLDEEYINWKLERRRRFKVLLITVPGVLGALGLILMQYEFVYDIGYSLGIRSQLSIGIFSTFCLVISGLTALMHYLQTGFKKVDSSRSREVEFKKLKNELNEISHLNPSKLDNLEEKVAELESFIDDMDKKGATLNQEERENLIETLHNKLLSESSKEFIEKIEKQITENSTKKRRRDIARNHILSTLDRLEQEVESLSRRGNLNLSLGIFTAVSGLIILGIFVFTHDANPQQPLSLLAFFLPRLSLVIFIEIFAYFFLRLYKSSLSEIKYFQNEMTNIEAKLTSLSVAISVDQQDNITEILRDISKTDRNQVLESDQTTVELEKAKLNNKNDSEMLQQLASIFQNSSQNQF